MKQFKRSTRSADIGGARFWRIDPSADYGLLNGVARHRIRTKLIEEHLRQAGADQNTSWFSDPSGHYRQ